MRSDYAREGRVNHLLGDSCPIFICHINVVLPQYLQDHRRWSYFDAMQQTSVPGCTVFKTTFRNRSENRTRRAAITVDWHNSDFGALCERMFEPTV